MIVTVPLAKASALFDGDVFVQSRRRAAMPRRGASTRSGLVLRLSRFLQRVASHRRLGFDHPALCSDSPGFVSEV